MPRPRSRYAAAFCAPACGSGSRQTRDPPAGSGSVPCLVDEKPLQATSPNIFARCAAAISSGSVITNPSAQYAAQGSGGIINIVLRRNRADGVTGTASLLGSSHGRVEGSATIKAKRGKWGFEGQAQATVGRYAPNKFRTLRTVDQPDGSITVNSADGENNSRVANVYLSGKAIYEVGAKTSLSLTAAGGFNRYRSSSQFDYLGLAGDFDSFTSRQRSRSRSGFRYVQLDLDRKGKAEGETLKGYAIVYAFGVDQPSIARFDDGGGYGLDSRDRQKGVNTKVDWVHPIGTSQILSVGASFDFDEANKRLRSTELGPAACSSSTSPIASRRRTLPPPLTPPIN